jgi:hypothetical protein
MRSPRSLQDDSMTQTVHPAEAHSAENFAYELV